MGCFRCCVKGLAVAKVAKKAKTKAKGNPKSKAKSASKSSAKSKNKAKKKPAPKTTPKAKAKPKTKVSLKAKSVSRAKRRGVSPGAKAPDFRLRDGNGKIHRLIQYQGKKLVLYFYPKDDTPGCTLEAGDFNKQSKKMAAKGAVILGVSPDNEVSHKKFSEILELNFCLLADPDGLVAAKYGAYGEKTLFGTKFNSVFRTTFIIDEEGTIKKVFRDVHVKGHAMEVLKAL